MLKNINIRNKQIPIAQISSFIVTGRYYGSNNRFRAEYLSLDHAMSINLWNGSVWAKMEDGTRVLIKRVSN